MAHAKKTVRYGLALCVTMFLMGIVDHAYAGDKKTSGCTDIPQAGKASVYSESLNGEKTSSGEVLRLSELTAAHRCLPFGSIVQVTDLKTNKTVRVRINDRGPFVKGRIIDLTTAAMRKLGHQKKGVYRVALNVESLPGQ